MDSDSSLSSDVFADLGKVIAENNRILGTDEVFSSVELSAACSPVSISALRNISRVESHESSFINDCSMRLVNTPPVSKWLSLNEDFRSRGLLTVVPSLSDTAVDGERLLGVCSDLLRRQDRLDTRLRAPGNTSASHQLNMKISELQKQNLDQKNKLAALTLDSKRKDEELARIRRISDKSKQVGSQSIANSQSKLNDTVILLKQRIESLEKVKGSDDSHDVHICEGHENTIRSLRSDLEIGSSRTSRLLEESGKQSVAHEKVVQTMQSQIQSLQEQNSRLQYELASRPTHQAVNDLKEQLSVMHERELSERKMGWRDKSIIKKDKISHSLGLKSVLAEMPKSEVIDILQELSLALKVKHPLELPETVRSLAQGRLVSLNELERMKSFIQSDIVEEKISNDSLQEEVVQICESLIRMKADAMKARSYSEILVSVKSSMSQAGCDTAALESLGAQLDNLIKEFIKLRSADKAFAQGDKVLAEDSDDLMNKIVKQYMHLFGVSDVRMVVPSMNLVFRKVSEMNNFWKAVCSELELDHKTTQANKCFDELSRRFFERARG